MQIAEIVGYLRLKDTAAGLKRRLRKLRPRVTAKAPGSGEALAR